MPYLLTDKHRKLVGRFSSEEDARASQGHVQEWRTDGTKTLGWVDPVSEESPDYVIVSIRGGRGGFVNLNPGAAIVQDMKG